MKNYKAGLYMIDNGLGERFKTTIDIEATDYDAAYRIAEKEAGDTWKSLRVWRCN